MRNRYDKTGEPGICRDALAIVDGGASNLRGVANAMIDMVNWLQDAYTPVGGYPGDVHPDKHPAVRLCMSQMGVVSGASPSGDVAGFEEATRYCREQAAKWAE